MNLGSDEKLPELPPYSLDVQAMELGEQTRAVGLELVETESREPVLGPDAAAIWSASVKALAAEEPLAIDFFSHLDRVREFCKSRSLPFREEAGRCLVVEQPSREQLLELFGRFEKESFGARAGLAAAQADPTLEADLSRRGLDAYQDAYPRYTFCGICEPEDGWLTLLSESLWASEIIRRVRPALQEFDVYIARPQ